MFRRVLSGLFVAALALAGAAVAPVRPETGSGWISAERPVVAQPGRSEPRVVRGGESRGVQSHPLLALLPGAATLELSLASVLPAPAVASPQVCLEAGSPHGARAPPA
jgi:hypothetical protein